MKKKMKILFIDDFLNKKFSSSLFAINSSLHEKKINT